MQRLGDGKIVNTLGGLKLSVNAIVNYDKYDFDETDNLISASCRDDLIHIFKLILLFLIQVDSS